MQWQMINMHHFNDQPASHHTRLLLLLVISCCLIELLASCYNLTGDWQVPSSYYGAPFILFACSLYFSQVAKYIFHS